MESSIAFFVIFSLVLFATSSTDARKDSGEYWQGIMQDQPMPETIQGLLHKDSVVVVPLSNKRSDCDHDKEQSTLVKDGVVEPQPSATEKAFVKDFDEQGPNILFYTYSNKRSDGDQEKEQSTLVKVEPQPSARVVVVVHDAKLTQENHSVKDSEPSPRVSKKAFVKDFGVQGPNFPLYTYYN